MASSRHRGGTQWSRPESRGHNVCRTVCRPSVPHDKIFVGDGNNLFLFLFLIAIIFNKRDARGQRDGRM